MKVIIDRDACVASGQCVLTVDTVFDQDDDGIAVLLEENPPEERAADVREAATICPAQAIRIDE